jgi:hypothetical protein
LPVIAVGSARISVVKELVTVATFSFPAEADVQKLLLEQEGIQAFLADANLVGTDWLYGWRDQRTGI